jgi:ABC-type protease/lipase transport system fused ATPase/permease subunit
MDLHDVPPVDVHVRNASLALERPPPLRERLHGTRRQPSEPKCILRDVSLDVSAGSFMAIIGASGSGKALRNPI